MENCEWCGQEGTKHELTFQYFAEGKWLHVACFEKYADEVLKQEN